MSDVDDYIKEHMSNPEFAKSFNEGLPELLVGEKMFDLREASGMTQKELAKEMHTTKSAISRMENHPGNIRLSTLRKFASVFGKRVQIEFV
ncbi:MAG: helix-turn-helix transcriptional regulator [Treponema sp.]|nr:helix-turn-helix transcriptional regulator [Treponema sp.]